MNFLILLSITAAQYQSTLDEIAGDVLVLCKAKNKYEYEYLPVERKLDKDFPLHENMRSRAKDRTLFNIKSRLTLAFQKLNSYRKKLILESEEEEMIMNFIYQINQNYDCPEDSVIDDYLEKVAAVDPGADSMRLLSHLSNRIKKLESYYKAHTIFEQNSDIRKNGADDFQKIIKIALFLQQALEHIEEATDMKFNREGSTVLDTGFWKSLNKNDLEPYQYCHFYILLQKGLEFSMFVKQIVDFMEKILPVPQAFSSNDLKLQKNMDFFHLIHTTMALDNFANTVILDENIDLFPNWNGVKELRESFIKIVKNKHLLQEFYSYLQFVEWEKSRYDH